MINPEHLENYRNNLEKFDVHIYMTNSCYDHCRHCFMNAVSECSPKSKYINTDDLTHFVKLMKPEKKINIGLSGGDPLLHPEISEILDALSPIGNLNILTSGYGLSKGNPERRKILDSIVRNEAILMTASPEEEYHSIDKETIAETRDFIKKQGYKPGRLGYSEIREDIEKKLFMLNPIGIAVTALKYASKKFGWEGPTQVIPIGRAKKLSEEQKLPGRKQCEQLNSPGEIYVGYDGQLQYCLYTCHDGFMNISELRDFNDKQKATNHIINRLSEDISFKDMSETGRCYFSKKIRKK